jgi:hypothetical protein
MGFMHLLTVSLFAVAVVCAQFEVAYSIAGAQCAGAVNFIQGNPNDSCAETCLSPAGSQISGNHTCVAALFDLQRPNFYSGVQFSGNSRVCGGAPTNVFAYRVNVCIAFSAKTGIFATCTNNATGGTSTVVSYGTSDCSGSATGVLTTTWLFGQCNVVSGGDVVEVCSSTDTTAPARAAAAALLPSLVLLVLLGLAW